jgi:hypothetical protein
MELSEPPSEENSAPMAASEPPSRAACAAAYAATAPRETLCRSGLPPNLVAKPLMDRVRGRATSKPGQTYASRIPSVSRVCVCSSTTVFLLDGVLCKQQCMQVGFLHKPDAAKRSRQGLGMPKAHPARLSDGVPRGCAAGWTSPIHAHAYAHASNHSRAGGRHAASSGACGLHTWATIAQRTAARR